jgi:uncharacterized protein
MTVLDTLVESLRQAPGLRSKLGIQASAAAFGAETHSAWLSSRSAILNGDDAAAIPEGDGYLLFAAEGIIPEFIQADPWFAGFCSVMVNISDIAAMGGVPYAVTDVLFAGGHSDNTRLLQGIKDASTAFGVPVVGGHTGRAAQHSYLSVSIVGRARTLLSSFNAQPGDALVAAIDLRGTYRGNHRYFNAATSASSEQLRRSIALLPQLAAEGLAHAAKDISQAGIAGTLVMLCETSNVGATLDFTRVPMPPGVEAFEWLTTFPSFGFILACDPCKVGPLVQLFRSQGIASAQVGAFDASKRVDMCLEGKRALLWDLGTPLTGMARATPSTSAVANLEEA